MLIITRLQIQSFVVLFVSFHLFFFSYLTERGKKSAVVSRNQFNRSGAILFFGNPGALHEGDHRIGSISAARFGFESIRNHIISYNNARGWQVDIFFHSWDVNLESELVALYEPLAHKVGEVQEIDIGSYGLPAATEASVYILNKYVSKHRLGKPYDRVLLLRFDTIFFANFSFDRISDEGALYVANWCKAGGRLLLTDPGIRECFELVNNSNDIHGAGGLPDFYFAGSTMVINRFFTGLHKFMLSTPTFKKQFDDAANNGGIWPGGGHFIVGARAKALQQELRLRRYLHHHMDFDMVRTTWCGGPDFENSSRLQCIRSGLSWFSKHELLQNDRDIPQILSPSLCERGEAYCACNKHQRTHCYAFIP